MRFVFTKRNALARNWPNYLGEDASSTHRPTVNWLLSHFLPLSMFYRKGGVLSPSKRRNYE